MANLQERRNKEGKIVSYSIRVFHGRDEKGNQLKPYSTTFKVESTWNEKTARKKAEIFAAEYEKECRMGLISDAKQTFASYCNYVIDLKEQRGVKHSTIARYRDLAERINEHIGEIKLMNLRAQNLNKLYTALSADGLNKRNGGKLSTKTIIEHHRLISVVLKQAVKEELIYTNVADLAEVPKLEKKRSKLFSAG